MTELVQQLAAALGGGSVVALASLLLTLRQKRRGMDATADSRIMNAAAGLVEQTGAQIPNLMERITRLEASNERILDEQAHERAELVAWRAWGAAQMTWAAQAVAAIRQLGGTIPDPPPPPNADRRQTPPTN